MPWAKLDDGMHTHPKIMAIGNDALAVWACSISYAAKTMTDGRLTRTEVNRLVAMRAAAPAVVDELLSVRLWEKDGPDRYQVHDFTDWNISVEEWEEVSKQRSEAGRRGGLKSAEVRRAKAIEASASVLLGKNEAKPQAKSKQKRSQIQIPVPVPEEIGMAAAIPAPGGAAASRTLYEQWADRLRAEGANRAGILGEFVRDQFGWSAPPEYSRIAKMVRDVGGAGELLTLFFEALPHAKGIDNPLDYVQGMVRRRKSGNGTRPRSAELIHPSADHAAPPSEPLSPEDQEERASELRAARDRAFEALHKNRLHSDPAYKAMVETQELRAQLSQASTAGGRPRHEADK